jgi:hypothetical protein
MPIIAQNHGGTNVAPIAPGSYAARCYSMVQIGTITENIAGTDKELHKVRITWELPNETAVFKEENGEQPRVISEEYTLSLNEKANLRKMLQSWRGKAFTDKEADAFDITVLVGKPCMLSISQKESKKGNTFSYISAVSLLPKGMECPPQINASQVLSFDTWDDELFQSLPDFIKDKIKGSKEYNAMQNADNNDVIHDLDGNPIF